MLWSVMYLNPEIFTSSKTNLEKCQRKRESYANMHKIQYAYKMHINEIIFMS